MKFNRIPIYTLLVLSLFSCKDDENIISSNSLNKAEGIYKYKEKPFTGRVLDTTKTGRVILSFVCLDGKINGDYFEYYQHDGLLKAKTTYVNGIKSGPYLHMSDGGDTLTSGNFLNFKKNGVWKEYHDNGNIKSSGHYKNNLQDGEWKYYYDNKNIKAVGMYKNGNETELGPTNIPISGRFGKWLFYSEETGNIESEIEYENGKISGQGILFHENGKILFKGNYKKGEKHGLFETFDEEGKLLTKKTWENGKLIKSE